MPIVELQQVTKSYRLYRSPMDRLKDALLPSSKSPRYETFHALSEVSLTVEPGEFVGVVGRNGAGKSTLLRILAGVTPATSGRVTIVGARAALLELGGGFNPDFTGRENIYFSSAIMGYDRAQVDRFVETIVAFADIGDFIDRPVRTYSSGMYVRLAFAVAANVDPDVLIVDEVIAVGDVRFQQKCLRKIREFKARGKAIILVTHDTGAVINFCDRALWIEQGRIAHAGPPDTTVREYLAFMHTTQQL